jgi:outer membrane protein assembly factor BamB
MRKLLVGVVGLALVASAALAQPGTFRVHTKPKLPTAEALERMSLTMAWSARILLRGDRDGFYSVQLIPGPGGYPQVLVQTFSNLVVLFDGETGDELWRAQVADPYVPSQPCGYNSNSIFVTRRRFLYVLNRATGLHRVYTIEQPSGLRYNGIEMPYIPTAAPVADDFGIAFAMTNRVVAYKLPLYGEGQVLPKAGPGPAEGAPVPLPELAWTNLLGDEFVRFPPLSAGNQLSVATSRGMLMSLNRFDGVLRDEFELNGSIVAAPGQHGMMAYPGTDQGTLYALQMDTGKLLWRFYPGAGVRRSPAVTDRDVFVTGDRVGLYRVSRDNGRDVWLAKQLDRFLAVNERFVYALNYLGEFQVLDYLRGGTLSRYDMRDWTIAVPNELTDRIYLASNDGQILCLRHRDLKTPLRNKTIVERKEKKEKEKVEPKEEPPEKDDKDKGAEKAGWHRPSPAAPRFEAPTLWLGPAAVAATTPLGSRP